MRYELDRSYFTNVSPDCSQAAQNEAADNVASTLGMLSVAFNANAEADKPTPLVGRSFTAVFEKKTLPPAGTALPPVDLAARARLAGPTEPVAVFAPQENFANSSAGAATILDGVASSGGGSGSGFLLPPGIPALEGRSAW